MLIRKLSSIRADLLNLLSHMIYFINLSYNLAYDIFLVYMITTVIVNHEINTKISHK